MTDLFTGFAPTVRPPVLPRSDVAYAVEDTPIGTMLLACNDTGALVASTFLREPQDEDRWLDRLGRALTPRVLRQPAALDTARRELAAYLGGRARGFSLAVDLTLATTFQRTVLTDLAATVGYGHRSTYGALAADIGRPTASRAVGAALGANPLCVVLPCHRVVASSGALTGYAGGLEAKRFLLDLESAVAG